MKRLWLPLVFLASVAVGCGGGGSSPSGKAAKGSAAADSNLVLARVAGRDITVGDLRYHMVRTTGPETVDAYLKNPDIVQVALTALVDQYVWAEMAKREGYKLTDAERRKLYAHESEFLATRYVQDKIVPKARPTEQEIRDYYDQHQQQFLSPGRAAVRHILVGSKQEAESIKKMADDGADFATLAEKYSKDDLTRDLGGALGFVQKGSDILGIGKNDVFTKTVLALDPGQTAIVQTEKGWHVVKVEKREGGGIQPLDEVRKDIVDEIVKQRINRVLNAELDRARDITHTVLLTKNFEKFTGYANNCERLMDLAANHPQVGGQVELYRRVAFDFPDCKEAPRAQFMIGYLKFTKMKDPKGAKKALKRLQVHFGGSSWAKAGKYLTDRLDRDPASVGTPEEILAAATSGGK